MIFHFILLSYSWSFISSCYPTHDLSFHPVILPMIFHFILLSCSCIFHLFLLSYSCVIHLMLLSYSWSFIRSCYPAHDLSFYPVILLMCRSFDAVILLMYLSLDSVILLMIFHFSCHPVYVSFIVSFQLKNHKRRKCPAWLLWNFVYYRLPISLNYGVVF